MAHFLTCLAVLCVLPWVADAVKCAADGNGHTYGSCNYCGFSNITTYVEDIPSYNIQYHCLPVPVLIADGYSTKTLNKCTYTTDSQPNWYKDIKLNLCNQDMCNTGCTDTTVSALGTTANPGVPGRGTTVKHGDAACAGIGFSTLISIALLLVFTKV
uniref:Ly6/PLAUR domain-containing protein 1-like n=1 Tax=Panagrellus redivivus TaxID=6233 RepID=A0A7E4VL25_PANRE